MTDIIPMRNMFIITITFNRDYSATPQISIRTDYNFQFSILSLYRALLIGIEN
jgi:hypothetical protein